VVLLFIPMRSGLEITQRDSEANRAAEGAL
jgi:hypothetical protein